MDSEFALPFFSHPDSSTFHLFVGFHYTLKHYGGWIRPIQLRCHYSTVQCIIRLHETFQMWLMSLNNGGGSFPCNTDAIFIVFNISFNSAITLFFRYACPHQEQLLVPRPHCFLTHEDRVLLLIFFFRRFAYHSQYPQGSWHLRCLVFLWQYRAVVHWNRGLPSISETAQITLLSLLFELSSCAWFTRTLLLVWDVARHGLSTPFLKNVFSFQILVLSYELFTSLAFFSHYPGDHQSHEVHLQLSDETIILRLQSLLDLFTSRIRPPWTLLGLSHIRKRGMGILNTQQGEVCMVAPPLLDVHS